jgi:pimeloyl-ACP methyl ester carboxylesterase
LSPFRTSRPRLLFLPGAGGRIAFWEPVANLVDPEFVVTVLGWPGFGDLPRDDSIESLNDLTGFVLQFVEEPTHIVAQSMGGVVAMNLALEHPELVRSLVLTGTSGGVDVASFGGDDWRAESPANDVDDPDETPSWFVDYRTNLTGRIPSITAPALLIWGESDPISPPAVGGYLARLLPNAELVTLSGGHAHPMESPVPVAMLIGRFVAEVASRSPTGRA